MNTAAFGRPLGTRILAIAWALWFFAPRLASADVVVPPQRADLLNLRLTVNTSFEPGSGLYTYEYEIENRSNSQQNVEYFILETGALVSGETSPPGWSFSATNDGQALLDWSATELGPRPPGYVDDGNVRESPFTIKPGETLGGFSFQSTTAPGTITYYVQGFVKAPQVTGDASEILDGGFDLSLMDFRQNSVTGTIEGPVAECADGVDNDGDGLPDLQDPGCRDARWPTENPDCDNDADDDGDELQDHPDDPGCHHPYDLSEVMDCQDGIDSDLDGLIDFPADPQCSSLSDPSERAECRDGIDNDLDGSTDYPWDVTCKSAVWPVERSDCADGTDNDGDNLVDFGEDPECVNEDDFTEEADCGDGIDNDGDGLVDFPADINCSSLLDVTELPDCSDGIDNDGDGETDGNDPACLNPVFPLEGTACDDDQDNDGNGDIDWDGGPGGGTPDPDCDNPWRNKETPSSQCGLLGLETVVLLFAWARLRRRQSVSR